MGRHDKIKVVDIFAGPGGLGEGFSSFEVGDGRETTRPFKIVASAEKDPVARQTLLRRAFFRRFGNAEAVPDEYYELVRGERDVKSFSSALKVEWQAAEREAMHIELGPQTAQFHEQIRNEVSANEPWILVGGPPCQAYSVAGRSRNKGKRDYEASKDNRHFLYREYLKILSEFKPDVFIMENVRGILTSEVDGSLIFRTILADLHDPSKALGGRTDLLYDIYPLSADAIGGSFPGHEEGALDRFLVRAEDLAIPQTRHRVILLGVRRGAASRVPIVLPRATPVVVSEVISDLPKLRSGLSKEPDSALRWCQVVEEQRRAVLDAIKKEQKKSISKEVKASLHDVAAHVRALEFIREGQRLSSKKGDGRVHLAHKAWYHDQRLGVTLNHDTRGHKADDLGRYLYCAAYTKVIGRSPTSKNNEFPDALAPSHESWKDGDFPNRFRVQASGKPASTVMSHISKDGHYYIHPDATQCRSFTVREAARVQTFPDNYHFVGSRTDQFVQVGNAVPPMLARQIAGVVWSVLKNR